MCQGTHIAAHGRWGTVEWGVLSSGTRPQPLEFFLAQSEGDRAKVLALFQRLAEVGRISSNEKFKNLGEQAGAKGRGLWEFKSFQLRFLGDFRPGYRFILVLGLRKKKDDLKRSEIEIAIQNLEMWDKVQGGGK